MDIDELLESSAYVILRHENYIDQLESMISGELHSFPYHIEPLKRWLNEPPHNHKWKLLSKCTNIEDAFYFMELDLNTSIEEIGSNKSNGIYSNRFDILKRDDYRCRICGRDASDGIKLEIDHMIPKSKGGKDTEDNLWTLCFDCNRGKSDKYLW